MVAVAPIVRGIEALTTQYDNGTSEGKEDIMARNSGDSFWSGFVLGAFVGAVMALLFAPAPGEETRERLRERGIELREHAEELSEEARKRAEVLAERSRGLLEERMARLEEAIEEGKKAAEETRQELRSKLEGLKAGTEA